VLSCCSVKERSYAEACILIELRKYELPVRNKLFRDSGATLLPMSISQVRSLLLVAPAVFRSVKFLCECQNTSAQKHHSVPVKAPSSRKISAFDRVINLIERFQILVAETTFYPVPELDGSALVRKFNRDSGEYGIEKLYGMACAYVKELDGVCALSQTLKDASDKPNVKRLIELYAHTIPAYGHVKHVTELRFESAHQPLKRAIKGTNNHDRQIAAVHSALENDLESRLALELLLNQPESMRRRHRIQRLLLGRECPSWLKEEPFACTDPLREPYLLDRLSRLRRKVYSDTSSKTQCIFKEELVQNNLRPDPAKHYPYPGDTAGGIWFIQNARGGKPPLNGKDIVKTCSCAYRYRILASAGTACMYRRRQGMIEIGSIVQYTVFEDDAEDPSEGDTRVVRTSSGKSPHGSNSSGIIQFWLVLSLLGYQREKNGGPVIVPYAHVQLCRHRNGSYPPTHYVQANSDTGMLQLGPFLREVLSLHACDQASSPCAVDLN
jgi:hypothetical protein